MSNNGWDFCKSNLNWFCENLTNDDGISDSQRTSFIQFLENAENNDSVLSLIRIYCRKYKLIGTTSNIKSSDNLGRLSLKSAIVDQIENQSTLCFSGQAEEYLNALLDAYDFSDLRNLLKPIENVSIAKYIVWSFRSDVTSSEPLSSIDKIERLPCRLGLNPIYEECLFFAHSLSDDQLPARLPTIFDAEDGEHWIPGGFTKPLCSDSQLGLYEYVHKPNTFADIKTLILEVFDDRV